jgi:4-amino-4-deoxy-L-arabinose transferase-like glycosyltransferase
MKLFGQNEWAARLPLALAGISGVWAAWLLGGSIGGRRVGFWSALILQTSLLYFVMARMLTTDMFLTSFNTWAIYFFWRSWQSLNSELRTPNSEFFGWHLAGWVAIALGFLTKGPIALAIPLVALAALMVCRWKSCGAGKLLWGGLTAGLALFLVLALPWFLAVFRRPTICSAPPSKTARAVHCIFSEFSPSDFCRGHGCWAGCGAGCNRPRLRMPGCKKTRG